MIIVSNIVGANRVVTASIDRTIKIWDISRNNTANPMQTITTNSSVESGLTFFISCKNLQSAY
jgi:hypothetical protein